MPVKENKINFYDEVQRVATELYEKSGGVEGRDLDNWLDAERIVMAQYKEREKLEAEKAHLAEKVKKAFKKVSQKLRTNPKR